MIKILFVCLGNICRSPMAQFVATEIIKQKGLEEQFKIDSAGTENYNEICHAGIDLRAKQVLKEMHIPFNEHYAHKITLEDYKTADYILTMDESNIEDIQAILGPDQKRKIHRLLDYTKNPRNIKDPWYTGNFDETYWDIVEGIEAFLTSIQS